MGEIHPHLIRYWLHSSEKTDSPETFAEKVNEICIVYHEAETVHENGGHTISVDEMTGIQALEHKYPDKPVIPGKAAHMEFEYIRHGTVSLIGFFDVATGRMEKPYLNSTRTEKDFVEAIRALIETDPEAPWTFVCDGLNIHKSESLVRFVAGQCGLSEDLGSKGRSGILKNQESRAEFLHHKDHRIRIVYTPKHCSWMNQTEIWFGIINRCLIMCSAFFQGWLYTTNANVFVLNLSQIWIPLILTAGFFLFFYCSKENIRSIGINSVLFLSIHYPVKWVVSGAVSFDVLSIISSI